MADESQTMADINWRLVEDAKEAMARQDWMLALSLFEQSRRICINEGWRDGVHYADDIILAVYPLVKVQIDESNAYKEKSRMLADDYVDTSRKGALDREERDPSASKSAVFDENPSNRRLRRMMDNADET